jgi:hypothetical protein
MPEAFLYNIVPVAAGTVIFPAVLGIVDKAAKLEDETDAGLFGIAFNTELTRKLSVTTASPTVQALTKTTVVPVVAVKSVDTRRTPFLYTSM